MHGLKDLLGHDVNEGDVVAYPQMYGSSAAASIAIVSKIKVKTKRDSYTGGIYNDYSVSLAVPSTYDGETTFTKSNVTKAWNYFTKVFKETMPDNAECRAIIEEAKKYVPRENA